MRKQEEHKPQVVLVATHMDRCPSPQNGMYIFNTKYITMLRHGPFYRLIDVHAASILSNSLLAT